MQKRTSAGLAAGIAAVLLATGITTLAQSRVDDLVRADFFAGFAGSADALERGMKLTAEMLEADPDNAPALVWHGAGSLFRSGAAFRDGDFQTGIGLWEKGLAEMAQAVAMAPEDVEVLIPRGATSSRRPATSRPIRWATSCGSGSTTSSACWRCRPRTSPPWGSIPAASS